jgi:EAL domain-containing protein (putative c-di-GMP-specific phosphodiesterase class I)
VPHQALTVTVNMSHRQFYHPDLMVQLSTALATNPVDSSRLLIEVAESTLNENPDAAVAILQRIVDCNVRVAVDNFGSSLAPLSHLMRLPLDVLKLTPKLTAAAASGGRQRAVMESLIHLGQTLGMQVIAQGIETVPQLNTLLSMGCVLGQGHLLSHAMDPARATRLVDLGHWAVESGA